MSAKFPRGGGGGGSRTFFSSKSIAMSVECKLTVINIIFREMI